MQGPSKQEPALVSAADGPGAGAGSVVAASKPAGASDPPFFSASSRLSVASCRACSCLRYAPTRLAEVPMHGP